MTAPAWEIVWTARAVRAIERLPEKAAVACVEFVHGALAENPHRVGRQLRWELSGKYSVRRGDFRVVYEIDESAREVVILAIGHRSDVYRQR